MVVLGARLGWIWDIWLKILLGHIWGCFEEFWVRGKTQRIKFVKGKEGHF